MKCLHLSSLTLAVAAACAAVPAAAQTIVNGSFENATLAPWTVDGAIMASSGAQFAAPDGSTAAVITFAGFNSAGRLSQTFSIAAAGRYEFSFFLGRAEVACGCNDVPLTFRALVDANLLSSQLPGSVASEPFSARFERYAASLDLAAGNHLLAFEFSRGPTSFGRGPAFVLDGVGAVAVAAPVGVPEPATWTMMIAGFGMVGGALRRAAAPAGRAAPSA